MKKQLYIKIYETCLECNGTGWLDEEDEGEGCECWNCKDGKTSKFVKVFISIANIIILKK